VRSLLTGRSPLVVALLLFLVSLFCTQIPLFNYLGFEFSALISIIGAFATAIMTIHEWRKTKGMIAPIVFFFRLAIVSMLLLLVPLVVMIVNALFVKNCSFAQGFMFFVLVPLPAVLFAVSVAMLISVALKRWRRLSAIIVLVLVLSQIIIETFTAPQIFSFNQIVGYFPGFTYDELLEIGSRLLLFRVTTVAWIVLLLILAHLGWVRHRPAHPEPAASSGRQRNVLAYMTIAGAIALIVVSWLFRSELGMLSTVESISDELGGVAESDHFVIVYPKAKLTSAEVQELVDTHEFMLQRVSIDLRTVVRRKIHSFIYESAEQKGQLVGAANTNIAKPWLWQLHLNLNDVDQSLRHELVHVVAADFGFPLLRIGLNPGLIEGLAMAVERTAYDETLHDLAAQVFDTGIRPQMEGLFSFTGFIQTQPAVSYVLAGSFSRYLLDQYGLRRYKRLYRTGSFTSVYGKDLEKLVWEWRRQLNRRPIAPEERVKASYLFKRPTIFKKVCPRVIASLNIEANNLLRKGNLDGALALSGRSLELARNASAIITHATAMKRLDHDDKCIQFLEREMSDTTISHSLLPLNLLLGDAYWGAGKLDRAVKSYERLLASRLSAPFDEAASLRLYLLGNTRRSSTYQSYFTRHQSDSARIDFLSRLLSARTHDPAVTHFLLGREFMNQKNFRSAREHLQSAGGFRSPTLDYALQIRFGRTLFALRDFQRAKMHFWNALNFTADQSRTLYVREWIARCEWLHERSQQGTTADASPLRQRSSVH